MMREDYGTQLENGALRFVRDLPGPIERVWEHIVDPEKRVLWLCGGTEGEKPGDPYIMEFDNSRMSHERASGRYAEFDSPTEIGAEVVAIDPPRLFVFRWADVGEETRIELSEKGDRVELVLIQSPPADLEQLVSMAGGWHAHLAILVDELSGAPHRGFWTEHDEAEDHYREALGPTG
jgi:uncharacterized protein YndB with AHSA1/START domain